MLDLIGKTIDRYVIIRRLAADKEHPPGEDRWGSVFEAHDPKFDRLVAIQVLPVQLTQSPKQNEYLLQVMRAELRWRHPGIARILDHGLTGGESMAVKDTAAVKNTTVYIVREHLPGANLQQLLDEMRLQGKWINLKETLQLVRRVSLALEYAHQRGIPHGDLNPADILLEQEPVEELPYQPVLVNLGLNNPEMPVRASNPSYEPPELSSGGKIEARSDLYAVGALLYELATGQAPRQGATTADREHPTEGSGETGKLSLIPPRSIRPDLPEVVEQIILKAMADKIDERFADAASLSAALAEALAEVSTATTTPPGAETPSAMASTLLPFYKNSLVSAPAAIPEVAHPAMPAQSSGQWRTENVRPSGQESASQDIIHILLADHTVHSEKVKPGGMTFGRGSDNDLVLNYAGVSRHHARLEFDADSGGDITSEHPDGNYTIRDLNSLNGTFLDEKRLEADKPYIWLPGEFLRIGEVWLRLERAEQGKTTMAGGPAATQPMEAPPPAHANALPQTDVMMLRPDGSAVDPSQVKFSEGEEQVGVATDTPNISVTPGKTATASILLFNRGPKSDFFRLTFVGIPLEWIPNRPQSVNLPPNGQREVQITFRPPRSPESRAGRHIMTVRVVSQNAPNQVVEIRLAVTLAGFSQFTSEINPRQVISGSLAQVVVQNLGNLPEAFTVGWDDKLHEMEFEPPQAHFTIAPGQSAIMQARPSLAQPRWFGGEMSHSFGAIISSESGQHQTHAGEFISKGLIPAWAPVALLSMCILLACLSVLLINQITTPDRQARQTDVANQAAIAQLAQATSAAGTATANALVNANQATIQAVTATAAWQAGDADADGLANAQEVLYGTRPDLADTDEDGLKDGDEVNTYKTNPLVADTDGDGLKDGVEVERKIDPLKKDTDGDGLIDSIDPDPGHIPTATIYIPPPTIKPVTPTWTTTPPAPTADLTISINNGVGSSVPGTSVVYTIQASNKGPSLVTNAQVISTVPSGLINVSWTCSATASSRCQSANGSGNINTLVDIAVNGKITFLVNATVAANATGLLINSASINAPAGTTELNNVDNLAVDTDSLTPKVSFAFSITDNRNSIAPGEATAYAIVATNNGPSAVSGASIVDFFPESLTGVVWTCAASTNASCTPSGMQSGNVNVLLNMGPGSTVTINVSATVKNTAAGTLTNTVYLSSPVDPANNNKTAMDSTTITPKADLKIGVEAPITTTVSTPFTYTITITNTGISNATGVILNVQLPAEVIFIASQPGSPTCTVTTNKVTCNMGDLPVGATLQIKIAILSAPAPGIIAAPMDVNANEQDPLPADNQVTVQVLIE